MEAMLVDGVQVPSSVVAPGSSNELTLVGSGVRSVRLPNGVELKVTVLAIYADPEIVHQLSEYQGRSVEQLLGDDQFARAFLSAPVDITATVTFLLPLTGEDFAKKSGGNTVVDLKKLELWSGKEELALEQFNEFFSTKDCPPGSKVHVSLSARGFEISHSKDSAAPTKAGVVIESRTFAEVLIGTMLSVSPALQASFSERVASMLRK